MLLLVCRFVPLIFGGLTISFTLTLQYSQDMRVWLSHYTLISLSIEQPFDPSWLVCVLTPDYGLHAYLAPSM